MPDSAVAPSQDMTLAEMIQRTEGGCQRSAQQLFDVCRQPLLAAIRRVTHRRLRTLFDSDDFLLETFSAVFTHHFEQEMLQSPTRLWAYLKRVAENKVLDAHRKYLMSERSNLRCEVHLEAINFEGKVYSPEESPLDALVMKEFVEERLKALLSQMPLLYQAVVKRLLAGQSASEVATKLGIKPKDVYRVADRMRKKIMKEA